MRKLRLEHRMIEHASYMLKRRDFIKLTAFLPFLPDRRILEKTSEPELNLPNIIILVFDTLSARHTSVDGYERHTTPNLQRFAKNANVYHKHYSTGNFTSPGTVSLLTSTYPWTHRAFRLKSLIPQELEKHNIFTLLKGSHHRIAYSHNDVASMYLYQFQKDIDNLIPTDTLCLLNWQFADNLFKHDFALGMWRERMLVERVNTGDPSSSPEWLIFNRLFNKRIGEINANYEEQFPHGLPFTPYRLFTMEDAVDWLSINLPKQQQPFLSYFHFLPPHNPYNSRGEFIGMFSGGWEEIEKPAHHFDGGLNNDQLKSYARAYDEYIAYADAEFGRLYDNLLSSGMLDNTILIVTSDHGELFERGIWGHETEVLYDSVIRVPLLISCPNQKHRVDIRTPTSSIDIVPTILRETGYKIPDWCEGEILPGFPGSNSNASRNVFIMEAKGNAVHKALTRATIALVTDEYKLIRYIGYPGYDDIYELYNVETDPFELDNLYSENNRIASEMRSKIMAKLTEVNKEYR